MACLTTICVFAVSIVATNWSYSSAQDTYRDDGRRPSYRKSDNERRIQDQLQVPHFRSGAQQSEAVLQQILEVLQRMDQRVEKLERYAEAMQRTVPNSRNLPPITERGR